MLGDKVMCVQLHGDAAFTGQGVVMEGLGLSEHRCSFFNILSSKAIFQATYLIILAAVASTLSLSMYSRSLLPVIFAYRSPHTF
jgi:hypothetical protein